MGRRNQDDNKALKHKLTTRVADGKYQELQELLKRNPRNDMSSLVRSILYRRPVTIYTKDETVDLLLEELAALRAEIKAIGVNINQITRHFNAYSDDARKRFYAKAGFTQYMQLNEKVEHLLRIIGNLAKKWLSE